MACDAEAMSLAHESVPGDRGQQERLGSRGWVAISGFSGNEAQPLIRGIGFAPSD
jgi:hypothetical protein